MRAQHTESPARRASIGGAALALSALLAGCEVTNPGPVQDEFLNEPTAHAALVQGAAAKLAVTTNYSFIVNGHAAREIYPSGQGNPGGVGQILGAGAFNDDNMSRSWYTAHAARWIAEDALRRFESGVAGTVAPATFARAYLIAGYSNSKLGQDFCEAVFDGGPREPNIRYFERAEKNFTDAIAKAAGEQLLQAYAGRAQVRMFLKKWPEAAADAAMVPLDFRFALPADEINNRIGDRAETRNFVYDGNSNNPFRAQTIHFTWFYDYYTETGDPRTAWRSDPRFPRATQTLVGFPGGAVPWSFAIKYKSNLDPFPVAHGDEMVLIRAEAALNAGQWQDAMTLINSVRTAVVSDKTGQPLEPWPATSIDEAWTALKRERAVVLWLEGRRMGDLRRWKESSTPGSIDWPDWEATASNFVSNPPKDCVPIQRSELDTNPNL